MDRAKQMGDSYVLVDCPGSVNQNLLPYFESADAIVIPFRYDDVVIMRDLDDVKAAEEVNVGDIAVYLEESKDSITSEKHYTYLTHRVYDKAVDEKGDTVFIFKGDNNNAVDKNTVKPYQIKGKYLCNIKGVGQAVEFLTSMSGIITLVAILCMLFSLDSLLTYILDKIYGDKKLSEPSDDANTTGTDGGNPEQ